MSRIPRFFHEASLSVGSSAHVTGSAHHHLAHVLRLQAGAYICLFNGDGLDYYGSLRRIERQQAVIDIDEAKAGPQPSPLRPVLAVGVSKSRHFDLALQKATELGVASVLPIAASRSPGHAMRAQAKQHAHWRSVLTSACEQCGRTDLPDLQPVSSIEELAEKKELASHLRLLLDPAGKPLQQGRTDAGPVVICCGPEGGFTDPEKRALTDSGFLPVSCGPRILRTETTPLAMLAIVQYLWGDLG